jgi:hypothetical protein
MVQEGAEKGEEGGEIDVLLAGVGAIKEPFQFIQEIIILILQRPALGEVMFGINHGQKLSGRRSLNLKFSTNSFLLFLPSNFVY